MSTDNTFAIQVCPRCDGPIEVHGSVKLAARSRATADREVEICSPCGSDEALRFQSTGLIVAATAWPVDNPHEYHRPLQDHLNSEDAI